MIFLFTFSLNLFFIIIGGKMDPSQNYQDLKFASTYLPGAVMENTTFGMSLALGCNICDEIFYHEPPPGDIMFIPTPPIHPNLHESFSEVIKSVSKQTNDQCNFCNLFYNSDQQLPNSDGNDQNMNNRTGALVVAFLIISVIVFLYLICTRQSRIAASLARAAVFKSNEHNDARIDKSQILNDSRTNSGVHVSDPCYLQTTQDKNLTSPIVSDYKKTSIPSKYWTQPGTINGRTVRRVPNEYEIPSSRTNSTGASSAVYTEMNDNNQRLYLAYNLHTYAEVRETLEPNHSQTSSNSSVMYSESNYDNSGQLHGTCASNNVGIVTTPNGPVQDVNSNQMRPILTSSSQGQQLNSILPHHMTQARMHHNQKFYEQPLQRAQMIITSNHQGVNPTLLNYKKQIHDVI